MMIVDHTPQAHDGRGATREAAARRRPRPESLSRRCRLASVAHSASPSTRAAPRVILMFAGAASLASGGAASMTAWHMRLRPPAYPGGFWLAVLIRGVSR